jgi:hypothetical protein
MEAQIYYNTSEKMYFILTDILTPVNCCKCNIHIPISKTLFVQRSWNKKQYKKLFWCERCIKHTKKLSYDEYFIAVVTTQLLPNSTIIADIPPMLKNSNTDVWSAALSNEGISADCSNVQIINRCKLAFKEEEPKEAIDYKVKKRLLELDKPIEEKEAEEFFNAL